MSVDQDEVKAAMADVERRKRVARRCIATTIASTQEIVDEIGLGDFPSPSTLATLELDLASAREKFQDVHNAITALLIVDLLPADVKVLEADLQNLESMKKTLGSLARQATKPRPSSTPSVPTPSAPVFKIQSLSLIHI